MIESNIELALRLLPLATWETIYMVFVSAFVAGLIGIPLGVLLFMTGKDQPFEKKSLYQLLSVLINIGRSFPFAILIIVLIPFTRFIVGTSLGTTASIVPLSIAAFPYIARIVELSLQRLDKGLIEATLIMGSTPLQMIKKVLLPEALPSIVSNYTVGLIHLVGYSAMAGFVGGGGLGTVAIQYGYQRFNGMIMLWTVILLIAIVFAIQWLGNLISYRMAKKRGLL